MIPVASRCIPYLAVYPLLVFKTVSLYHETANMSNQTQEGWHTVEDGTKLYTKTWKVRARGSYQLGMLGANRNEPQQSSTPKARLLFVHGFSDHCM